MGIDNKDELDDELVKSLERLVEEETSVAKAFVDNQKESSAENTAAKDSQDTDIEMGKTKAGNSVPNSSLGIAIARHNNRPFNTSSIFFMIKSLLLFW